MLLKACQLTKLVLVLNENHKNISGTDRSDYRDLVLIAWTMWVYFKTIF